MPRLTALRRRRRDRGAVAALVAVLLAGNVLLGFAALVVDVGLLYVEREELQSGADAAAVAVAKVCAVDITDCTQNAMEDRALKYAKKNAKDGAAAASVCGRVLAPGPAPTNQLDRCPADPTNLTACIGDAPADPLHYVEVRTRTGKTDGTTTILPPAFAGAVTGTSGTTVGACSRVSWGPVLSATVAPAFAISICPFNKATDKGTVYQPPPSGPGLHDVSEERFEIPPHWERAIDTGCPINGGPSQMTDGFVWLTGSGFADCSSTVVVNQFYDGLQRKQTPERCVDKLREAFRNSTPLPIPIFDDIRVLSDGREQVHVAGIAAFVITGWWTQDGWENGPEEDHEAAIHRSHLLDVDGCKEGNMCIYGYFAARLVATGAGTPGDPTYGTYFIRTIG